MKKLSAKNKFRIAAILFVLVTAVLYFLIYVAPKVSDVFVETYTAEFGTLDVDSTADVICVRNERLYTSDGEGAVKRKIKAGSLMRRGSRIVTVNGVGYYNQERGLVSYYYDRLEKKYTPDTMKDLDVSYLTEKKDSKGGSNYKLRTCRKKEAKKGSPIFKIVDNHNWYLVTWMDAEKAKSFIEGNGVTVEFSDKNQTQLRFRVYYVEPDKESGDGTGNESGETDEKDEKDEDEEDDNLRQVILSCDRYYARMSRLRYETVRIITSKVTGIILETSSIAEEEGVKGVYVKNKYGEYVFTPISIIAEVGDKTVVESRTFYDAKNDKIISTVKNYDSIKKGDGSEDVDQD